MIVGVLKTSIVVGENVSISLWLRARCNEWVSLPAGVPHGDAPAHRHGLTSYVITTRVIH